MATKFAKMKDKDFVTINVRIPEKVHKRLKKHCFDENKSLNLFISEAIDVKLASGKSEKQESE